MDRRKAELALMARTRTEGLERYKRKMALLTEEARAEIRKANNASADEFMAKVRAIIPKGDPANGNLVDTLEKQDGEGTGVIVSIGGPDHPYPLHLEAGHKARDGSHVPGKPFWNPTKRVLSKRHRGRAARALNKAIKKMAGAV
jgi:hypothetical protein